MGTAHHHVRSVEEYSTSIPCFLSLVLHTFWRRAFAHGFLRLPGQFPSGADSTIGLPRKPSSNPANLPTSWAICVICCPCWLICCRSSPISRLWRLLDSIITPANATPTLMMVNNSAVIVIPLPAFHRLFNHYFQRYDPCTSAIKDIKASVHYNSLR